LAFLEYDWDPQCEQDVQACSIFTSSQYPLNQPLQSSSIHLEEQATKKISTWTYQQNKQTVRPQFHYLLECKHLHT
jgi:hypothetical protein